MNLIFVPSKCYKARHEGDCKSSPKSNYVYFDIESGRRNVPVHEKSRKEVLECLYWECLIDWGEKYDAPVGQSKKTKKAFNKWRASCEPYIKRKGYPVPPLFNNYNECDEYCLIDP
ncbi:hypothetical protein RF11_11322 [Thelohanellus kitauei]|uniref:Uncharacterized protein n=1 Tax=Thelohanellus kitauei TaxID=669202 RepID=A0A0C2IWI3_THEKT|nr:hypothetical protein RF11_11322 [Thelohanellus kitauei]